MVGVPRSKGCLTCRRRKVACDQTRPQCQNCQKRGVSCEGYARYPTILQYTGTGLKKRERFEEAVATSSNTLTFGRRQSAPPPSSATSALPNQPATGRIVLDQFGVTCLDTYFPVAGTAGAIDELKHNWMWMTLDMPDWGTALGSAFAALCIGRVGAFKKDESLISTARTQYASGLSALQHALTRDELKFKGQTLAAIRTLSIYEMSTLPFTSMSKAYVHEEGMTQWCLAAGPQSINTHFTLQVFHDVRWCIMNRAIDGRQHSSLGTEEWKTIPWNFFPKDSLQCLFDIGFDLAMLLERLDVCDSPQPPEASVSQRARLSLSCDVVQQSLDDWYRTHWSHRDTSLSPSAPSVSGGHPSPASSAGNDRPEFESLWEATNIAYFWLFKMILNDILAATAAQEDQQDLVFSSLELAVNIVSASSYFLDDATGWLGPQRLFFPLRRAMALLMSRQSPFVEDAQQAFGRLLGKLKANRG